MVNSPQPGGVCFRPLGTFSNVWICFWLLQLEQVCTIGVKWVEAGDAAKHSAMHRTDPPPTKNYQTQNANIVNIKKPCDTFIRSLKILE